VFLLVKHKSFGYNIKTMCRASARTIEEETMVNAVTSVSNGAAGDIAAARAVVRQPTVDKSPVKEPVTKPETGAEDRISPRISQDSLAGALVTEFSNADGEITQQVPSKAALAYLRAGLTADGNAKPKEGAAE
jgi:hypothetical protein